MMDRKHKSDFLKGFLITAIALGAVALFMLIAFWILF